MTDPKRLVNELFSRPSSSNSSPPPREEDEPLHPELAKLTIKDLLEGSEKGRSLLKILRQKNVSHQSFLQLSNILRDPIMQFCKKQTFPTRHEQRSYLAHLLSPYPHINQEIFVSRRKQESGLLENSIRNARRRDTGKRRSGKKRCRTVPSIEEESTPPKRCNRLSRSTVRESRVVPEPDQVLEPEQAEEEEVLEQSAEESEDARVDEKEPGVVQLHPELLAIRLQDLLHETDTGRIIFNKIQRGEVLQRTHYLTMANVLRIPIMKYCEKVCYPSRYELRAFLDHLFAEYPNVDPLTFVCNKKQSLGCLENSIRNARRLRKSFPIKSDLAENLADWLPAVDELQKFNNIDSIGDREILKDGTAECSSVEQVPNRVMQIDRRATLPASSQSILKPQILKLTLQEILDDSDIGKRIYARISRGDSLADLDKKLSTDLANLIRPPIMENCAIPGHPSRQELLAYFAHLFNSFPNIELAHLVETPPQNYVTERNIQNLRRGAHSRMETIASTFRQVGVEEGLKPEITRKSLVINNIAVEVNLRSQDGKQVIVLPSPTKTTSVTTTAEAEKVTETRKDRRSSQQKQARASLDPRLEALRLRDLLAVDGAGRALQPKIDAGQVLDRKELMTICKLIRGPLMEFSSKEFYPRREEMRSFVSHLFADYPNLLQQKTLLVSDRKQHLGLLEDSVHNIRRRARNAVQRIEENIVLQDSRITDTVTSSIVNNNWNLSEETAAIDEPSRLQSITDMVLLSTFQHGNS